MFHIWSATRKLFYCCYFYLYWGFVPQRSSFKLFSYFQLKKEEGLTHYLPIYRTSRLGVKQSCSRIYSLRRLQGWWQWCCVGCCCVSMVLDCFVICRLGCLFGWTSGGYDRSERGIRGATVGCTNGEFGWRPDEDFTVGTSTCCADGLLL